MILLRRIFGFILLLAGVPFFKYLKNREKIGLYERLFAWTYAGLADAKGLTEMERDLALQARAAYGWDDGGDMHSAIADYTRLIEANHAAGDYHSRAECYYRLGEWDKAFADYDKAIELDPDNPQYIRDRAYAYFQGVHDYRKAIHDYKYLIKLNPHDTDARSYLAMALRFFGSKAESLTEYKRLLEIDPNDTSALNGLAMALSDDNRDEEALPYYDRIIALDPDVGPYYNNRGMALYGLGRYQEALRDLDKAVELYDSEVYFRTNRGQIYIVLDRLDEALVECNRAVELEPGFAPAWLKRGILYLKMREPHKAEPDFERALQARFEDSTANALFGRAIVKALRGDWEGARADTAVAVKSEPLIGRSFARYGLPQKEIIEELLSEPTGAAAGIRPTTLPQQGNGQI